MSIRASQAARDLLQKSKGKTPVNVKALAKSLNIPVIEEVYKDDISGMLVIREENAIISVNKKHHKNRQRFSIAHELGHYLLHGSEANVFIDKTKVFLRDKKSSEGTQLQEIEANGFAAELLMPEALLKEKIIQKQLDLDDEEAVESLAKQFKVSVQALTHRLIRLGIIAH